MRTIYTRVSDSSHTYVAAMAAASGLPMSVVLELLISEALTRGWSIKTTPPTVREEVQPPAPPLQGAAPGTAAGRPPQPRRGPAPTDS